SILQIEMHNRTAPAERGRRRAIWSSDGGGFMAARRRGFTIVELLVVIAIIGMLTAILLPAVGAARRAARMAQCQSNMRQVASAANTFHQRFNRFPGYNEKLRGGSRAFAWTVALLPELDQNQLYDR